MVTFLSAAKNTQHKGDPQQSTPVRRSSFQLRALRKHSETIQTQMLHCPTAYTTASEVSFRLLRRFSRNTDRIRGDILVLSWLASRRANRGRQRHLRSGWNEEHLFTSHIYHTS